MLDCGGQWLHCAQGGTSKADVAVLFTAGSRSSGLKIVTHARN